MTMKKLAFAAAATALLAGAVQAGQPSVDAQIADLKAKTMAMTAKLPPLQQTESAFEAPAAIWRVPGAVAALKDGPDAPEMVVIPAGEYTMGWKASSPVRFTADALPPGAMTRHRVRIAYPFAMSKYPVTVGEFAKFAAETKYTKADRCQVAEDGIERKDSWREPGFPQTERHPVVCVNYDDSIAYLEWLSKKTGKTYRLPSDAEYEYANRAGTTTVYWWGDAVGVNNASCGGACGSAWDNKSSPPVGSFKPNPFGLYDTTGAVWSRLADCWNETFENAPHDGSVNLKGDCKQRVFRGGGFRSNPLNLRSALRHGNGHDRRFNDDGFHVVRVL
jgi:formylglycine-generating enzyme required for sulfatase activity